MSKSLSASNHLMQTYLTELLTEEVEDNNFAEVARVKEKKPQPIEQLLNKVNVANVVESPATVASNINRDVESESALKTPANIKQEVILNKVLVQKNAEDTAEAEPKNYRQGSFQAMFFDVAGLTIAVPLIELGGIHKAIKTTALMGKPDWFKGVMVHRDVNINAVDTALWVMPEKCDETLMSSLNYQYIIMLNDSPWGLMAENLVDTVTLTQQDVKWLDSPNKRPWLAGLVKNRMCALLDVDSLIGLLDKGVNISQE